MTILLSHLHHHVQKDSSSFFSLNLKISFELKLCREVVWVRNCFSDSSFLSSNARPLFNGLSHVFKPVEKLISSNKLGFLLVFVVPSQTLEGVDVHCFGHLLYEMTYGRPPDMIPVDNFPPAPSVFVG